MTQDSTNNKIGKTVQVNLRNIQDRLPEKLIRKLSLNPEGMVVDYKMTDGQGVGLVLEFEDGTRSWFFQKELENFAKNHPQLDSTRISRRIEKEVYSFNKDIDFLYNDKVHQNGNTECGVYCLHFLIHMLKGYSFKKYITNKRDDVEMEKFREIFYIPSNE